MKFCLTYGNLAVFPVAGILKPMSVRDIAGPRYRARQNVAMAAILRANQVTAAQTSTNF